MTNIAEKQHRILYFDYLRVFAIVAVMTVHIAAMNWHAADVNGIDWQVFNFYDSISRWGVPIFVMISGALFLNRDDIPVKTIYSKYILRLVIAYFVWSFIYYLFQGESIVQQLVGLVQPGKMARLLVILSGHYHLWFIPMLIGIYICLPVTKQIVKNNKIALYFLVISFIFWFLFPQIVLLIKDFGGERLITITNSINNNLINGTRMEFVKNYTFYFILGYEVNSKT